LHLLDGPTHHLYLALLQRAQNLRLNAKVQLADLVKEERAAVCRFELARCGGSPPR
jgi:hypothetical protein